MSNAPKQYDTDSNANYSPTAESEESVQPVGSWLSEMTPYFWIVVILCTLGWSFDCFDQQLFALNRAGAVSELMNLPESDAQVGVMGGWATSLMLIGWATGGIFFGIWADKYGRVRVMMITLLFYSLFTGLCGLAQTLPQFLVLRFLTGLGVGGQFAVCATLIAETLSNRARPMASGTMQAFSAMGNIFAALSMFVISAMVAQGALTHSPWRYAFALGFLPIILVILNGLLLHEPEVWVKSKQEAIQTGRETGSIFELFFEPTIRYRVIMGMLFAMVGVIGFWGIMLFAIDLNRSIFRKTAVEQVAAKSNMDLNWDANVTNAAVQETIKQMPEAQQKQVKEKVEKMGAMTSLLINLGGFIGMYSFAVITGYWGRRKTFTFFLTCSLFSVLAVFLLTKTFTDLLIFTPLMGFSICSLMGGYTIYFPELFPTRLRSTGVSFCYNVGRYLAAAGPAVFGGLTFLFHDSPEPFRLAGAAMSPIFLIGILIIWLMPETKDQPLPE